MSEIDQSDIVDSLLIEHAYDEILWMWRIGKIGDRTALERFEAIEDERRETLERRQKEARRIAEIAGKYE